MIFSYYFAVFFFFLNGSNVGVVQLRTQVRCALSLFIEKHFAASYFFIFLYFFPRLFLYADDLSPRFGGPRCDGSFSSIGGISGEKKR